MNPYLRRTLDGNEQTALLEHASDLLTCTLSGTALAVLPSGHIAKITAADRSTLRGGRTNVVFHVDLSAETSSHPHRIGHPAHTYIPGLAGRNSAWLRCCQQVRQCCRDRDWVMLEGEKGSGRARLAQAVGQDVKPGRTVRVMRAETFPSAARLVAELAAESGDEDFALVIADVDDIDKDTLEAITSILATRAGRGWIAATSSGAPPSAPIKQLLPLFTHTVTVPPLRHRIDDLAELVPLLLREITRGADVGLGARCYAPTQQAAVAGQRLAAAAGSDRNRCPPTIGHYQRRQIAAGVPLRHSAQADPNRSPGARCDCP